MQCGASNLAEEKHKYSFGFFWLFGVDWCLTLWRLFLNSTADLSSGGHGLPVGGKFCGNCGAAVAVAAWAKGDFPFSSGGFSGWVFFFLRTSKNIYIYICMYTYIYICMYIIYIYMYVLFPSLQRPDPQKVRHRQRWLPGFPKTGLSFNSDGFSRQNTTEPGLSPCCPYSMIFFIVFLGDCSTIADTAMSDVATEVLEIFVVRWFGIHPSLEGCQGIVWFSDAGTSWKMALFGKSDHHSHHRPSTLW